MAITTFQPKPVELPKLAAGKDNITCIEDLDKMVEDAHNYKEYSAFLQAQVQQIKHAKKIDNLHKPQHKTKTILAFRAMMAKFEETKATAEEVAESFFDKYDSLKNYKEVFRDKYDEIVDGLQDDFDNEHVARVVKQQLQRQYLRLREIRAESIPELIEKAEAVKTDFIEKVTSSAESALEISYNGAMAAERTVELYQDHLVTLKVLKKAFDLDDDERVNDMLDKLTTMMNIMEDTVADRRAKLKFPDRGHSRPSNAKAWENQMKALLEEHECSCRVLKIRVVEDWVKVTNVPGEALYFWVAGHNDDVAQLLLVEGRVQSRKDDEFESIFVAEFAEMLVSNL